MIFSEKIRTEKFSDRFVQNDKERELAALRATEENQLASAVLSKFAHEERERGEVQSLHARHEELRMCGSTL